MKLAVDLDRGSWRRIFLDSIHRKSLWKVFSRSRRHSTNEQYPVAFAQKKPNP